MSEVIFRTKVCSNKLKTICFTLPMILVVPQVSEILRAFKANED